MRGCAAVNYPFSSRSAEAEPRGRGGGGAHKDSGAALVPLPRLESCGPITHKYSLSVLVSLHLAQASKQHPKHTGQRT